MVQFSGSIIGLVLGDHEHRIQFEWDGAASNGYTFLKRIDEHTVINQNSEFGFGAKQGDGVSLRVRLANSHPQDSKSVTIKVFLINGVEGTRTAVTQRQYPAYSESTNTIVKLLRTPKWASSTGGEPYALADLPKGRHKFLVELWESDRKVDWFEVAFWVDEFVSMDEAYTTDYFDNQKTVFRPGEYIQLWHESQNHTAQDENVVYDWIVADPSGATINYLSYKDFPFDFPSDFPPGQKKWKFERGLVNSLTQGEYAYVAQVTSDYGLSTAETTFTLEGNPIPPNLLDTETAKGIDEYYEPVDITSSFTSDDSKVYAWSIWEGMEGTHTLRWDWHRPDGTLFTTYDSTHLFEYPIVRAYAWLSTFAMGGENGTWSALLFVDDQLRKTIYFQYQQASAEGAPTEFSKLPQMGGMRSGQRTSQFSVLQGPVGNNQPRGE